MHRWLLLLWLQLQLGWLLGLLLELARRIDLIKVELLGWLRLYWLHLWRLRERLLLLACHSKARALVLPARAGL